MLAITLLDGEIGAEEGGHYSPLLDQNALEEGDEPYESAVHVVPRDIAVVPKLKNRRH